MVERPGDGHGRPGDNAGHDSARRRAVRAGLSVLALDQERSVRNTDLQHKPGTVAARPPVRDGDGYGSGGGRRPDNNRTDASDGRGLRSGDVGDVYERGRRERESVSPLGTLDSAELPYVEDGYWRPFVQATSEVAGDGLRQGDAVPSSGVKLGRLTDMAMDKIEEILSFELNRDDESLMRIQMTGAQAILNSQIKVDEQQFRRQQEDRLPALLQILVEEREKMAEKR